MNAKIYSWYNALATMILTLLGFTSCDSITGEEPDMYGTPTTDFQLKGKVRADDNAPIKGIKVVLSQDNWHRDSTYTDANGNYSMKGHMASSPEWYLKEDAGFKLLLEDVDGDQNGGSFANDTISGPEITSKKTAEGSGWNTGSYELTAPTKTLKKK